MNNKGFTLIEVMIVIAIIGILLAVAAPQCTRILERGEGSTTISSGSGPSANEGTVIFNN